MTTRTRISEVLHGVQPSLGCTEPGAIALACALARRAVRGEVQQVSVVCDANLYRNALCVGVPGTNGLCGIPIAVALGALVGDPDLRLQVLRPVTAGDVRRAEQLVADGRVHYGVAKGYRGIHIEAEVQAESGLGRAVIEGNHTGVTEITEDGQAMPLPDWGRREENSSPSADSLAGRPLCEVLALADDLLPSEKEYLLEGMRMNQAAGRVGLAECPGMGHGANMARLMGEGILADDTAGRAAALAAAAADARMSGLRVPVMASGDSGNQGIVATVPIAEVARELEPDEATLAYALATSHLLAAYVKSHIGSVSALCGAYIAAAPGAAAGVIRLLGGDEAAIARAVSLFVGNVSGVICDGAKTGCAAKVGTAAGIAVRTAYQAMHGVQVSRTDGIVGGTPEESIRNLGRLAEEMRAVNAIILEMLVEKRHHADEETEAA